MGLNMGPGTFTVPLELFSKNRTRLCERLRTKDASKSVVLMQGGDEVPFYDTDVNYNIFRQESFFMWTFGVIEPGFYGAILVDCGTSILFMPRHDSSYAIWCGRIMTADDVLKKYKVDRVHYVDEIAQVLSDLKPSSLLTLHGVNADSGLSTKDVHFEGIAIFEVDKKLLYDEICELRVIKTPEELEVMKYVTKVSSDAHRKVMRMAKPGRTEYQCESEFLHHCYSVGGCRFVSYTCICGSGENSAVLHYGHAAAPNDRVIKDNEMCLFDMGANYFGYAADITCSYPVSGKFTDEQKMVYNAVLKANLAVFKASKPGASWVDMHLLALRTVLECLKEGGVLQGDVEDMMKAELGPIFQPHGLGHLIGLDVHDVGGYLSSHPKRRTERGVNKLRTARVLKAGMCMTIEPGCYFIDALLDEALADTEKSKFIVTDSLKKFRGFGGVRIEDDVYISESGCVNMTKVPRTVQEIEDWIAGKDNDSKYD